MNAIAGPIRPAAPPLVIGLVNNMAPGGMRAADAQFTALVGLAAAGRAVAIRRFAATPELQGYEPIDALWSATIDGLIVTGAEPHAHDLEDEAAWPLLARLVDWAAYHTRATLWSCLAAHAAVYRLDGLKRRRLSRKLSGIVACRAAPAHPLAHPLAHALAHPAPVFPVPHSRLNDVDEAALRHAGYTVLSCLSDGPVSCADSFTRAVGGATFLMLQGHPEYAGDTLLREYRRDLGRWRDGAVACRPEPPADYFDVATRIALAQAETADAALGALAHARVPLPAWRQDGAHVIGAWLDLLAPEWAGAMAGGV